MFRKATTSGFIDCDGATDILQWTNAIEIFKTLRVHGIAYDLGNINGKEELINFLNYHSTLCQLLEATSILNEASNGISS